MGVIQNMSYNFTIKITKLENNTYELEKEDNFINLCKHIILKLNNDYRFCYLQK